jgi:hypothetical protein
MFHKGRHNLRAEEGLASRAMQRAAVAMSERYDALLADHITGRLGLGWEYPGRGPQRNPSYELAAVPAELTDAFSRRSAAITEATDRLIAAYTTRHGHQPNPRHDAHVAATSHPRDP